MQAVFDLPDPSIPPADGQCLLLALAPELRNEIYEYALSHDEGVLALPTRHCFKFHAPYNVEANQLKYVCWELYAETHGMLLRLNDIVFQADTIKKSKHDGKDPGVALADIFVRQCPHTLRAQLRKITIYHGSIASVMDEPYGSRAIGKAVSDSTPLSKFCRMNPKATVIIRFSMPGMAVYDPMEWIGFHWVFHQVLRAEEDFMKIPEQMECEFEGMIYDIVDVLQGVHRPPNFRLTLSHSYLLSKAILEAHIALYSEVFDEEGVDETLVATRKMYDEGI